MRLARFASIPLFAVSALIAAAAGFTACGELPLDCQARFDCPGSGGSSSISGGASSSGGSVASSSGGGAACVPIEAPGPVDDACGLFVTSGPNGIDGPDRGTKEKPYQTIAYALAQAAAAGTNVYACAETFDEAVTVTSSVHLYGGLDCSAAWGYIGSTQRSTLQGPSDAIVVQVTGASTAAAMDDFDVVAADATLVGGSSIGVLVSAEAATFTRCAIASGNAKAGATGATPNADVGSDDPTDASVAGNPGVTVCTSATQQLGGAEVQNPLCPASAGGPIGGAGGAGELLNGTNGEASPATSATAEGGVGQPASDPTSSWSCVTGSGQPGNDGAPGAVGMAATGPTSLGSLGPTGYSGVPGQLGGTGAPGQGGGGGGGAKGKTNCAGASGGSGGAGGCGGPGGAGGGAGGASIAVVSLNAVLSFTSVTIAVGIGGRGGDGGLGEGGGVGGNGGAGGLGNPSGVVTHPACSGGQGGQGGSGGQGGGGRGGHAVGIAYSGTNIPPTSGVTFTPGTAGVGGGDTASGTKGDDGTTAQTLAFP